MQVLLADSCRGSLRLAFSHLEFVTVFASDSFALDCFSLLNNVGRTIVAKLSGLGLSGKLLGALRTIGRIDWWSLLHTRSSAVLEPHPTFLPSPGHSSLSPPSPPPNFTSPPPLGSSTFHSRLLLHQVSSTSCASTTRTSSKTLYRPPLTPTPQNPKAPLSPLTHSSNSKQGQARSRSPCLTKKTSSITRTKSFRPPTLERQRLQMAQLQRKVNLQPVAVNRRKGVTWGFTQRVFEISS
jgi:hypothetical protein